MQCEGKGDARSLTARKVIATLYLTADRYKNSSNIISLFGATAEFCLHRQRGHHVVPHAAKGCEIG